MKKKEDPHKINQHIRAPMVRVVGQDVEQSIYPIREALQMAEAQGLDLVEISPTANPPVCKIMDYRKFLYELKKKQKEIKAKSARIVVKEIRLGPNTDDHDFNFKLKHAIRFLEEGAKIKVDVFFRGRSIIYKEQGEIILLKFASELEEYGKVEQLPKLEGKRMIMILAPKK
jgi:translation initiation factor IF-3